MEGTEGSEEKNPGVKPLLERRDPSRGRAAAGCAKDERFPRRGRGLSGGAWPPGTVLLRPAWV